MGCGCKKSKNTEVVNQPTEIKVSLDQAQVTNQTPTLTEEQQKTVDAIIAKFDGYTLLFCQFIARCFGTWSDIIGLLFWFEEPPERVVFCFHSN